ncbi:thioesterase [Streptomyces sp. F001]|uniref:thioesterase II family protein n=1 Tax=Streptomyces sp. F001 TaxID=1510026 RepID=UPI00101E64D6|nr:alpha/beta fold hydrolase [Streptomyces sp. F001]RZB15923.1 thioesterase [Streptomyces sp. F001]
MTVNRADTGRWIRRYHPAPDAPVRLLCLPHAGGSASYYFPFSQGLSPAVDVLCVQYPGRQDRRDEPLIDSIPVLADALADEVLMWADRPLAVFGHSMGATVAFELALRLERLGAGPLAVFVSGRRAPSRHRDSGIHLLDDRGMLAELRALSGTDARVFDDEELLRMVLPAIRSDYRAAETYRYVPGPRLAAPVRAHTGTGDPRATLDEVRAWGEHTEGGFELRTYPGGHFYLNDQIPLLLAAVSEQISELLPVQVQPGVHTR